MEIFAGTHLSYCTNIHPGENWADTFEALKRSVPAIKKNISPEKKFGIGLRLSAKAAYELLKGENLTEFKNWLQKENLYVFTMNGFPYGGFHFRRVKDNVHKPDWTTKDRVNYTLALFNILKDLLPPATEGGISTSPVAYKPWFVNEGEIHNVKRKAAVHLAEIALFLNATQKKEGKYMHLDLEPEPDGLLENTGDVIDFFNNYIFTFGAEYLSDSLQITQKDAITILQEHLTICYDICHFALAWEEPFQVIEKLAQHNIRIGKLQISAALEARFGDKNQSAGIIEELKPFAESTYLHQVAVACKGQHIISYHDLDEAMENMKDPEGTTWRIHYHVPVFAESCRSLFTTRSEILKVLELLKETRFTKHLEVETYTWEVLPEDLKMNLEASIERELKFVTESLKVLKAR
jgi:hypothetical protein